MRLAVAGLLAIGGFCGVAEAKTICTAVSDAATGAILLQEGQCSSRVTPASTFKIALSVMGFDAGFLVDDHRPSLPYRHGYPDWGGEAWKQTTDPTRWLKYSVVWYSQRVAESLQEAKLHDYAMRFGYGNADFSGDPGKHNGLERAWIGSSLTISPLEQLAFLDKLLNRKLPVSDRAVDMTMKVVESTALTNGWGVQGKTGMAYPRKADGTLDQTHPWGWYVGWVSQGPRKLVFARLIQEEHAQAGSAGMRTRDALLAELPMLAARLPQ